MAFTRTYQLLQQARQEQRKLFAVLIDPDKFTEDQLIDLVKESTNNQVHLFLVGGSLITSDRFEKCIEILKSISSIPVVIFPGSNAQISGRADSILLLSLISGRNPEYLIGQHVIAAPYLKKSGLEIIPTGYMLIEGKNITTANYMSHSFPIPYDKSDIAACTAMAGEMLGLKLIYMDGGSGAGRTISPDMVRAVKEVVDIPLIVGGGITNADLASNLWSAGADLIVVGNAIEKDPSLIASISKKLTKAI
jgi:putative glycerol-1-phosphate prenyltransferase